MNRLTNYLKNREFNLRERINVYGGLSLGLLAPIVLTRYVGFGDVGGAIQNEIYAWGGSALSTISFFPVGGCLGAILGGLSAKYPQNEERKPIKC